MSGAVLAAASCVGPAGGGGFATVNSPVEGAIAGSGPCTTAAARVTITGGTGPFTYAWSRTAGSDQWIVEAPSAQETAFTYPQLAHSDFAEAQYKVVVTDSVAQTAIRYVRAKVRSTSTL